MNNPNLAEAQSTGSACGEIVRYHETLCAYGLDVVEGRVSVRQHASSGILEEDFSRNARRYQTADGDSPIAPPDGLFLETLAKDLKRLHIRLRQQHVGATVALRLEHWRRRWRAEGDAWECDDSDESAVSLSATVTASRAPTITLNRHAESLAEIVEAIRGDGIAADLQSLAAPAPEPAGRQALSVYWSESALAVLCRALLQMFEADRVLAGDSLLARRESLPFAFSIVEVPVEGARDHEGISRRNVTILDRGKPRTLACTRRDAARLGGTATGHARRSHLGAAAEGRFWSAQLIGHCAGEGLLESLASGIAIEGAAAEALDARTGGIILRIYRARRLASGRKADAIPPFRWTTNLLELLAPLRAFSRKNRLTAYPTTGPWLLRVRTPSAVGEGYAVPLPR